MTGALLQLVANSNAIQNTWINHNPQITFYKRVYRRHTPFASELSVIPFNGCPNFGETSTAMIPYHGDLLHRLFLVFDIPKLQAIFPNTKSQDISNLFHSIVISDGKFLESAKNLTKDVTQIEFDRLFLLIDETMNSYINELQIRINFLTVLENYFTHVSLSTIPDQPIQKLESETNCILIPQFIKKSESFDKLKTDLMELWFSQKKDYNLIYQLIKLIHTTERSVTDHTPIFNSESLSSYIYPNILSPIGPEIIETLTVYNIIINVLNNLATTIPIIITKAFMFEDTNYSYNIYDDFNPIALNSTYFSTIIDPNFRPNFFRNGTNFIDCISSNFDKNTYLESVNMKLNTMISNINKIMDQLFERYRQQLFTSTDKLFLYNAPPVSNIYSYLIPQIPFQDKSRYRISNVFNANIWFFYFFKYLDSFNEINFTNYIKDLIISDLNQNELNFMKFTITLLKINLEYYMNEISYLLNDLYAGAPSVYPSDSMKNYSPISPSTIIDGININDELMAITIIFHRNHVPDISEMFQYIYHFIDTIDFLKINQYLGTCIDEMDSEMVFKIKSIIKIFYSNIFGYFMGLYDDQKFEPPRNFPIDQSINDYVVYFLKGNNCNKYHNYFQSSLTKVLPQMEFYFISEMVNYRETQKMYHYILNDQSLGPIGQKVITMINNQIHNTPNLYYETIDVNRYHGKPFLQTQYLSRNYGHITELPIAFPIPLPPTMPYGIDPRYYDHNQMTIDHDVPVYWTNNQINSSTSIHDHNESFQLFEIDYFRIKHQFFFNRTMATPGNMKTIDYEPLMIMFLIKLTEKLIDIYPNYDHFSVLSLSIIGKNSTDIVPHFFNEIEKSLISQQISFPKSLLLEVLDTIKCVDSVPKNSTYQIVNIIDMVLIMKEDFLAKWFYYLKHQNTINSLTSMGDINHLNSGQIIINILKRTTAIDCSKIPNMAFLYPNLYPQYVKQLLSVIDTLDDFTKDIIKYLLSFLSTESLPKLTSSDIRDIINITFISCMQIYQYSLNNKWYHIIMKILSEYHPLLINKLTLFDSITDYFQNIMESKIMSINDIESLANMAKEIGIDYDDFYNYIYTLIKPKFDQVDQDYVSKRLMLVNSILKSDLDYFLLKWVKKIEVNPKISFKKQIMEDLFCQDKKHCLTKYFNLIDNEYLIYLYFFMDFIKTNQLNLNTIKNPIFSYSNIPNRDTISDILTHLMDYIWNQSMYQSNISSEINQLITKDNDLIKKITNNSKILNLVKRIMETEIINLEKSKKELDDINTQISTILYRNQKAKTAWIRKLAHYLVKNVTIKANDQILDYHISDWFQVFHEISKNPGTEYGYHKMIGHRKDLITFDEKDKDSTTIILPLIFYFNRHISLSLPLCASTNIKYQITVSFRNLDEVAYKEKFSEFVGSPSITKVYLMGEYIYLGNDERKIFAGNLLEYLIEELQYDDNLNLTDNNLNPIFKICNQKKTTTKIKNGIKIKEESFCTNKGIYYDKTQLMSLKCQTNLLPRTDLILQSYHNKNGIQKSKLIPVNFELDPYIHYKRIEYRHHFKNLAKLMAIIIKPVIHITPNIRQDDDHYFNGERQWDNYGLYSHYNLSKINNAKKGYYQIIKGHLCDLEDANLGFINVINQVLYQLTTSDTIIDANLLEKIQLIKDKYNWYQGAIFYHQNRVVIKEVLAIIGKLTPNEIRKLVENITNVINIDVMPFHFSHIIEYSYGVLNLDVDIDPDILDNFGLIRNIDYLNHTVSHLTWKDVIDQVMDEPISSEILKTIVDQMAKKQNDIFNNQIVNLINYQDHMIENPKINPLIFGHLKFNEVNIMPENSNHLMWSEAKAYQYLKHTPDVGINLHSWALHPLDIQPSGHVNLSRIDDFKSNYDIHPKIGNSYPATITTMVLNMNIMRYLSGMCGKAW